MQWHRRILLVAAPDPNDPRVAAQRRSFAAAGRDMAARDLSWVGIDGAAVTGTTDKAAALRRRYHLAVGAFAVLLIGKDGHVAMRSAVPIAPDRLVAAIDAMPMRRAGLR